MNSQPTTTSPLTIRTAVHSDLDPIVDVVHRAYRGTGDDAGWTTESELLGGQRTDAEGVQAELNDVDGRLLVAIDGDRLVGSIKVDRVRDEQSGTTVGVHFGMFAVDPRVQSSGTGRRLLDAVDEVAHEWGATFVEMEVIHQRDDLKAWYERRGFQPTGETAPFPYGDERFGLPHRDDLYMDCYRKDL